MCLLGTSGRPCWRLAQPHVPLSPCPPILPSCPGNRSRAGCLPPSPGALWGKGAGAPTYLAAERQGRVFPLAFQTEGRGSLCWGGGAGGDTSFPYSVPDLLRMDSSCRSISTGEPICINRAKRLRGEEPLTCPSWVPADWQGWGASDPRDPCPYPLGRKLLCQTVEAPVLVCRARSITNTSVSAEPTACRWMPRADWGQYSQGSALSQSHPAPRCHPHVSPHAVNHILSTPTSHIPPWYPQPDPDPPRSYRPS